MVLRNLCSREAIDVVSVLSDDGLLLIPVCAECVSDVVEGGEQREFFGPLEQRRSLTTMPARARPSAQRSEQGR